MAVVLFLQEIGFDVVSLLNQSGFLKMLGAVAILALALMIVIILRRKRRNS